jgi:hypothetical protein
MGFDAKNAYKFEKDNLSFYRHDWKDKEAEKALLGTRYPTVDLGLGSGTRRDHSKFSKAH